MSNLYTSGVINIPSVTGNIVITATASPGVVSSISAVYTQSGTVYDSDSLNDLKAGLVVIVAYEGGATSVIPSTDYTLSGTLTAGTSTITVSYAEETTTFTVIVTHMVNGLVDGTYNKETNWSWTVTSGKVMSSVAPIAYNYTIDIPFKIPVQLHSGDVVKFDAIRDGGATLNTGVPIGFNGSVFAGGAFCPYRATVLAKTVTIEDDILVENLTIGPGGDGRSFTLVLTVNEEDVFV